MSPAFPCARCGRTLTRRAATTKRPVAIACPRCRFLMYDYPRPACGVLVVRGDDVLLLRRAAPPRVGCVDIPGGFLEAGEGLERAARRELHEETGLRVGALDYLGLYWDSYALRGFGRFPTMNVYFAARYRRGTPVGADDAASAEWVPVAALPRLRRAFAWAHMPQVFADLARWQAGGRLAGPLPASRPFTRAGAAR